ncbi:MAG: hypothetical protein ABIQ15_08280, partial [Nocardioides sp.]
MSVEPPIRFDALLELMPWGRNVYTVIKVPDELAARAGRESTRRVEGRMDGVAVNVGELEGRGDLVVVIEALDRQAGGDGRLVGLEAGVSAVVTRADREHARRHRVDSRRRATVTPAVQPMRVQSFAEPHPTTSTI